MYIDSEDFAIVGLVFFILIILLVGNIQDKIKQKRFVEICKRENKYFNNRKSNEEITRFIISDALKIGLHIEDCESVQEIFETWYYWNNYERKLGADISSPNIKCVGEWNFDTTRPRKDTCFGMPYDFSPVDVDFESHIEDWKKRN